MLLIENEIDFESDYNLLLRGLFETIHTSDLKFEQKRQALLYISEGLYRDRMVMDTEINAYATILGLTEIFEQ